MFKKIIVSILFTATVPAVMASNNLDIKVRGNIAPAACDLTLGNSGTIDYGNISPGILKDSDITVLPEKEIPLQIDCGAPMTFALKTSTRRPNTGFGGSNFPNGANYLPGKTILRQQFFHGLGTNQDGAKIGGYAMAIDDPVTLADGKSVSSIGKHPSDKKWSDSKYGKLISNYQWIISWSDASKSAPLPIQTLNTNLRVQAYIANKNKLDVNKPIKLNGMTTIELVYL